MAMKKAAKKPAKKVAKKAAKKTVETIRIAVKKAMAAFKRGGTGSTGPRKPARK